MVSSRKFSSIVVQVDVLGPSIVALPVRSKILSSARCPGSSQYPGHSCISCQETKHLPADGISHVRRKQP